MIIGPLFGGIFTTKSTWRLGFNIGSAIVPVIIIVLSRIGSLRVSDSGQETRPWYTYRVLDLIGPITLTASIIGLLFSLKWAGITRPWNDAAVIRLFVTVCRLYSVDIRLIKSFKTQSLFLINTFFYLESHIHRKSMFFGVFSLYRPYYIELSLLAFVSGLSFLPMAHYLPFMYQIKGSSAFYSGIYTTPFVLVYIITSIPQMIVKIAWYKIMIGALLSLIGFVLLDNIENKSDVKLMGYQIIYAAGLGIVFPFHGMLSHILSSMFHAN
jgi:hypothetical protein